MASTNIHQTFRQYHRWLGFFLAGIIAVYAVSGVVLIFRKTEFLKFEHIEQHQLAVNLNSKALKHVLELKGPNTLQETTTEIVFADGSYDKTSGIAQITTKDYPFILAKLIKLHKATTNSPLYWLNITFGISLLFFVVSALLMFMPKAPIYKSGLKIAGVGFLFAILVVMFGS